MKNSILTLVLCFIICSCTHKSESKVLFSEDFTAKNPQWKISGDTITEEFQIGFKHRKEPVKVSWGTAKDSEGCLRIAFVKLENVNNESHLKIKNLKTSKIGCAMKFNSPDTTRFETLILFAEYSTFKNVKEYSYRGPLITIMGNGEFSISKVDE